MLKDTKAADGLSLLTIDGTRGGRPWRGHLLEYVVGHITKHDAGDIVVARLGIIQTLCIHDVEADTLEGNGIERHEQRGGPIGVSVGFGSVIEGCIGEMERISAPLAATVEGIQQVENGLSSQIG